MSSNMQWASQGKNGKLGKPAIPCAVPQGFTDTQRLDWVGNNRSANHDSDATEHWLTTCVPQGALGNKNGASGKFLARGKSHRECIDKFLSGDIVRID